MWYALRTDFSASTLSVLLQGPKMQQLNIEGDKWNIPKIQVLHKEQNMTINDEVHKLMSVRIVRESLIPFWVANPILVK